MTSATTNRQANEELLADLRARLDRSALGGGEKARARHLERGKLLARQRVDVLLDPGSPFLELSPLAAEGMYGGKAPAAGVVAGIGRVSGRECLIIANDATVSGGTYYPMTVKKHLRGQEVALANNLPCIYLVDSGGAMLLQQDEVFPDRDHFGRIFYNQATMSAKGIPQIAAVMGSCTAGGAYVPAMSDEAVIVRNPVRSSGRPAAVKAATGRRSPPRSWVAATCAKTSGVVDHLADDDYDALMVREIAHVPARARPTGTSSSRRPDRRRTSTTCPDRLAHPYDVRDIIGTIVGGGEYTEFKENYGTSMVTAFAGSTGTRWHIGNNGVIFPSPPSGSAFHRLCDRRKIPLVFLQNITGFMVGRQYGRAGSPERRQDGHRRGVRPCPSSRSSWAVRWCRNFSMCGRAYSPRFLWMWPGAKIAVMGGPRATARWPRCGGAGARPEGVDRRAAGRVYRPDPRAVLRQSTAYYPRPASGTTGSSAPPTPAPSSAWRSPRPPTPPRRSATASSGCEHQCQKNGSEVSPSW